MTDKTIILSSKVFFYVRNKRSNQFIHTIDLIESTLAPTYLSDKKSWNVERSAIEILRKVLGVFAL